MPDAHVIAENDFTAMFFIAYMCLTIDFTTFPLD